MIAALSVTGFSDLGKPIKHAMLTGVVASCEVLDKQGLMNMRVDCPMWYQNSVPKIKKNVLTAKSLKQKKSKAMAISQTLSFFFQFFHVKICDDLHVRMVMHKMFKFVSHFFLLKLFVGCKGIQLWEIAHFNLEISGFFGQQKTRC